MSRSNTALRLWIMGIQGLTDAQRRALVYVQDGCPTWPPPHGHTMKSLERRGLIRWSVVLSGPPWLPTSTDYAITLEEG